MLKPFLEKVKTYDEVINCYRITGNENIVMEVVLKNQKHLESFIDQLIKLWGDKNPNSAFTGCRQIRRLNELFNNSHSLIMR